MILYLQDSTGRNLIKDGYKMMLSIACRKAQLHEVSYMHLNTLFGKVKQLKPKTKNTWEWTGDGKQKVGRVLRALVGKYRPRAIICQDPVSLQYLCGGDNATLSTYRGSVYFLDGVPIVILANLVEYQISINAQGAWLLTQDLQKVARWAYGKTRTEPAFDLTICATVSEVSACADYLDECMVVATDTETANLTITCFGFTGLHPDGRVRTFVVPMFHPLREGGHYWPIFSDEVAVWKLIHRIHSNPAVKALQNGQYDACYYLRYRVPLHNYLCDTLHLWHSIYTESPKSLDFLASVLVDRYQYWKADSKGFTNDDEKVPVTEQDCFMYWRYNGLDCHYTLLILRAELLLIEKLPWARKNYDVEFSLQMGPGLAATMRGMKIDKFRQAVRTAEWEDESADKLRIIRTMCDTPDFNPLSGPQFQQLLYDVLGATQPPTRGAKKAATRSVDEKVLKLVAAQHPMFAIFIAAVQAVKKPLNNISKYGVRKRYEWNGTEKWKGLADFCGRFMFAFSFAGTETGRGASKQHHFRVGTNAQNVPEELRDFLVADDGYVFVEIDYSQSDAFFVAAASGDIEFQRTMEGVIKGLDSHLRHAEFFFSIPYPELLKRLKAKDPFVAKKPGGVRDLAKRIVHGANFMMAGFTLLMTMTVENVVRAAHAAGHKGGFNGHNDMAKFCQRMLDRFTGELYTDLGKWQSSLYKSAVANGGLLECAFGRMRYFFGDLAGDKKIQREMAAYFGQGGTAGNINRTLIEYWYRRRLDSEECLFVTQTHDSLLFMIKEDVVHQYVKNILTIMEQRVTINGWTFHVPTEAKVGCSWGKGLVDYDPAQTVEDWRVNERQLDEKYLKKPQAKLMMHHRGRGYENA